MSQGIDLLLELAAGAGIRMSENSADEKWRGDCVACGGEDRMVFGAKDLSGKPWVRCWGRCTRDDVVRALGTTWDQVCPPKTDQEDLISRTADLSRAQPPRFAWTRRIVIGKFNVLLGNEGVGKGALLAHVMAKWTHGELDGDLKGTRVHVGIVGDEDDLDQTWTPRLHAAGADLSRIHQIERPNGGLVVIGADREQIAAKVRELGISILYFDQLLDNLGAGVDDWRQKQVREAIAPLRSLARELDIAALGTLHPNKRGKTFRELMSGTPAFNAASRSSLLLAQHPDEESRRVLVRGKGNLSDLPMALEFEIVSHSFAVNGFEFNVPLVTDMRRSELDIDDLIAVDARQSFTKVGDARELIEVVLPRDGLWHEAKPIFRAITEEGIDERTARRAKDQLKIEHRRVGSGSEHRVEWRWSPKPDSGHHSGQASEVSEVSGVNEHGTPDTPDIENTCPESQTPVAIMFDCETTGLDPHTDRLTWVGFQADDASIELLQHPDDRDQIQAWLDLDAEFWAHHATFDLRFLEAAGYHLPAPDRWADTALLANTAGTVERLPGGCALLKLQKLLIDLGELPADALDPEKQINQWLKEARRAARKEGHQPPQKGDAPAHILGPYLEADIRATRAVHRHYTAALDGQHPVYELERRVMPAIYAVEKRGLPLDLDAARKLREQLESIVSELEAQLFELAGHPLNLDAARQLEKAFLERGVDLSSIPRTPRTGQPQFTAQTLPTIDDEFARVLTLWRAEKKMADYVAGLWKHAHGDRLYGEFRQIGTQTGRMSSANPNLQNLPRGDLRVRYCIAAGDGNVLVGADLDSVEMRILACYAPGGELERAFAADVDPHQQTADTLGISRDAGKTLNYALLYGAGPPRIARQLGCSGAEAKRLLERWKTAYPEVLALRRKLWKQVERHGYLETIAGRRHYWPSGPDHMLLNRLVSGSAADLFKLAAIELHQLKVPVLTYVHDEVLTEVLESEAEGAGQLLVEALTQELGPVRGLKAEAGAHMRWSDFKQPGYVP